MKYEKYKQLTSEQKEEYDFKFRFDRPTLGIKYNDVALFYSVAILLLIVLGYSKETLSAEQIAGSIKTTMYVINISIIYLISLIIINIGALSIFHYKEYKFVKQTKQNQR